MGTSVCRPTAMRSHEMTVRGRQCAEFDVGNRGRIDVE